MFSDCLIYSTTKQHYLYMVKPPHSLLLIWPLIWVSLFIIHCNHFVAICWLCNGFQQSWSYVNPCVFVHLDVSSISFAMMVENIILQTLIILLSVLHGHFLKVYDLSTPGRSISVHNCSMCGVAVWVKGYKAISSKQIFLASFSYFISHFWHRPTTILSPEWCFLSQGDPNHSGDSQAKCILVFGYEQSSCFVAHKGS